MNVTKNVTFLSSSVHDAKYAIQHGRVIVLLKVCDDLCAVISACTRSSCAYICRHIQKANTANQREPTLLSLNFAIVGQSSQRAGSFSGNPPPASAAPQRLLLAVPCSTRKASRQQVQQNNDKLTHVPCTLQKPPLKGRTLTVQIVQ